VRGTIAARMDAAPVSRIPIHQRRVDVQVFERSDGLFDVEATLLDVKQVDMPLSSGVRKAGDPVHDMLLVLLVDRRFNVLRSHSETLAMPYAGHCSEHGDAYARLAGLNLLQGWRIGLKERVGGTRGCTPPQRAGGAAADRRHPGLRRPGAGHAARPLRGRTAVPARPLPRPAPRRPGGKNPLPALVRSRSQSQIHSPDPAMKIHEYQGKEVLRQLSA
jgi:hypothetical protein